MFKTRSIRQKLIMIIMGSVASSFLLGYLIFVSWFQVNQQRESQQQAEVISQLLSQEFAKLILINQLDIAVDISNKLASFDKLERMVLFNQQGEAIHQYLAVIDTPRPLNLKQAQTWLEQNDEAQRISFLIPANYQGLELGQVFISLRYQSLTSRILHDAHYIFFTILFALGFSFLMAFWLEKRFSQPVIKLVQFLERIISGEQLSQRIETSEINEFKTLYDEVNTMLARIQKDHAELSLAAVSFNTPSAIMITDPYHRIMRVNRAFTEITGYSADEILGKTPKILRSDQHESSFYNQIKYQLRSRHSWQGQIWNRKKDGSLFLDDLLIQPVYNEQKELINFVAVFTDITEQYYASKKLEELVSFDQVTGLSNRKQLTENLEKLLAKQQQITALICFDINDFKKINDVFGHSAGDELLVELANRLRAQFYDALLLARIGGDEFAMITRLPNEAKSELIFELEREAERILSLIELPFELNQQTLHAQGSVGISYALPEQTVSAETLIQQADAALHQAKTTEDQSIIFFDPKAEEEALAAIELYNQLKHAIKAQQLELYYQPQHHIAEGLIGAEALVRWNHPEKGLIPPNHFIPLAENSDLILPLGQWVLNQACQQLANWQVNPNTAHLSLAVNVSAKQFYAKDFVEQVTQQIKQHCLDARKLKLELTESLVAKDLEHMTDIMAQLTRLGVKLSLDDFGTGYSSLRYLQKLPLTQVKIDQSFICNLLSQQHNDEAIVKTIISLGQAYEFDIIAEGVETQAQRQLLEDLGCLAYQGYYYSPPLPIKEFTTYLHRQIL
ncbi:EAL domain-containing protein [Thiomicrospira microaerophila]|uniref:bifunctional diguanylate cyclase/phosphodiesterase n=1 Tax=Thiomicrospira microaerophila TaxID=406020 RepID=UPI00201006D8|nr:bifunctional diguanylate cyclase/phosphodiesterase [Thiomicrospira microaerophila]UQB42122.1 EAL domain-containing protein [Thiomicrospira microaerophila]